MVFSDNTEGKFHAFSLIFSGLEKEIPACIITKTIQYDILINQSIN